MIFLYKFSPFLFTTKLFFKSVRGSLKLCQLLFQAFDFTQNNFTGLCVVLIRDKTLTQISVKPSKQIILYKGICHNAMMSTLM